MSVLGLCCIAVESAGWNAGCIQVSELSCGNAGVVEVGEVPAVGDRSAPHGECPLGGERQLLSFPPGEMLLLPPEG